AILINISIETVVAYDDWILEENHAFHFFDHVLMSEYGIDMRASKRPLMLELNYLCDPNGLWNLISIRAVLYVGTVI
ncbi:hypothetical protein PENTCL1PPCAC_14353, partial [Pristionchus entomophagus]